jgi:Plasmid pRiA4b ORF-3-like protein
MAQRGVAVTGTVYQLRVVLAGISPMVWRRLLVPAETSVAGLHEILQAAFGWSDEHLHRFTIHAVEYGLWRPGSAGFSRDARQVLLAGFGLRPGERFTYEYNFFAGWRHDIRVEEILPRSPRRRYPACTGGARQAPPPLPRPRGIRPASLPRRAPLPPRGRCRREPSPTPTPLAG